MLKVLVKKKSGHHTFRDNNIMLLAFCFVETSLMRKENWPSVRNLYQRAVLFQPGQPWLGMWLCGMQQPGWMRSGCSLQVRGSKKSSPLFPLCPSHPFPSPVIFILYLSHSFSCRELQTQALLRGSAAPVWRKKRTSSSSSRSSASSLLNRLLSREDSRGKLKETCKIS